MKQIIHGIFQKSRVCKKTYVCTWKDGQKHFELNKNTKFQEIGLQFIQEIQKLP